MRAGYRECYGQWAGNPDGHAPDYTRCGYEVAHGMRFAQCQFKTVVDQTTKAIPPVAASTSAERTLDHDNHLQDAVTARTVPAT